MADLWRASLIAAAALLVLQAVTLALSVAVLAWRLRRHERRVRGLLEQVERDLARWKAGCP